MKKSTNIITSLIGVIYLVILFTCSSCDNSTDPKPKEKGSIIGTWQMATIKMYDTPIGELTIPASQFLGMSGTGATESILQFNEDNSASVTTTYNDSTQDTIPGTWTLVGDSLNIVGAGMDDTVGYGVDGNVMTLTRIMAINFTPTSPKEDIVIDMIYNSIE